MEFLQFINENTSKKMGVAMFTIGTLGYLGADPAYIVAIAIVEIVVQGYLDRKKDK